MTDGRGRRARWVAAASLGPVAALMFSGVTSWATGHQPPPTAAPAPQPSSPDDGAQAQQEALDASAQQVEAVRQNVAAMRDRARALRIAMAGSAKAARLAARAPAAGGGTGRVAVRSYSGGAVRRAAPVRSSGS